MRRAIATLLVAVLATAAPSPAWAYLKLGTSVAGRVVDATWQKPVRYFVSDAEVPGVTAADLRAAIARAAATWQAVPDTSVRFEYQGPTSALPDAIDGRTTIGFLDRPDLDRVLGATSLIVDTTSGAIVDADVFFNTRFAWSVAPQGEAGRVDLESVVLHELGHVLGLGHSALGETQLTGTGARRVVASGAVMFPIAMIAGATADRVLQPDDRAGLADLYPVAGAAERAGVITGRVTKNGRGVYGAHVVAVNATTGASVGNFSLDAEGHFVIAGLSPGPHFLRAEPLDDADIESFFSVPIDVDFLVTYGPRLVIAPRGGSSAPIEIRVPPK